MKKGLLVLGLLVLPLGSANAVLLKVDYSGQVYLGGGYSGYDVGEMVSGSLYIDTDLAPVDQFADIPSLGFYTATNNSDFVFGYTEGTAYDMIRIEDDFTGTRDYFAITDFGGHYDEYTGNGNYNTREFSVSLYAWDSDLDFLTGDGLLQAFDLSAAEFFQGEFTMRNINRSPGLETGVSGIARFNLDHLAVSTTTVDARIPEPGTLMLLATGLLGIGFARGRRSITAGA